MGMLCNFAYRTIFAAYAMLSKTIAPALCASAQVGRMRCAMTMYDGTSEAPHPRTRIEVEAALNGISPQRQAFNQRVSRGVDTLLTFIQRHWLAILNTFLATFIGVAFLAPVGYALGFTGPSNTVFDVYRFFCGQVPSHSFYIA